MVILSVAGARVQVIKDRWRLHESCVNSVNRGSAEGTCSNRLVHERNYLRFCHKYSFELYPIDSWHMCLFAQHLAEENKRPGTIENYTSSMRILHRLANLEVPDASQIHFRMLINCFKRENTEPVHRAEPMTKQILINIFQKVHFQEELQAVAWTALLVGYNLVLRLSNLGAQSRTKFNPARNLTRADYQVREGFNALGIRWAKNLQFKNRVNWCPLIPQNDWRICPDHWCRRIVQIILAAPYELMFLVHDGVKRFPLTVGQINRLLKQWCKEAEVDPKMFTSHCLRIGGLTRVHNANLTGEMLQVMGD